jgi:preprotein translocase subunit SecD
MTFSNSRRLVISLTAALMCFGCGSRTPMYPATGKAGTPLSVRLAKTTTFAGAEEMPAPSEPAKALHVSKEAVVTNEDLSGTGVVRDPVNDKSWQVEVFFTKEAGERVAKVTWANIGNHLAIFIDGKLEMAPRINAEIKGGSAVITSNFTEAEARRLAEKLVGR